MLNDVNAYKDAFSLSNAVWNKVITWDNFAKDTIGKQYVRAIDSVSANIAEGYGMHGKKDKIRFYRYARASTFECLDWTEKAKRRNLLNIEEYNSMFERLKELPRLINILIKRTRDTLKE